MEENVSVRFLVRKLIEPLRLVNIAQNQLIWILDQVRVIQEDNRYKIYRN